MARQKWKEKLRPASFRKISFQVDTSSFGGGRRGVEHEYPGRNEPYREDLGRKARTYSVEAYILGSNYRAVKDQLLSALEKEGPGELIHPYYGRLTVSVGDISAQESAREGGYCRFTIQFLETGELKYPSGSTDSLQGVLDSASALASSAESALDTYFTIIGTPQFVVDSAAEKVEEFGDMLGSVTSVVSKSAQALADLAFSIRKLKAGVRDILNTPAVLAEQINSAIGFMKKALDFSDIFAASKNLMVNYGKTDRPSGVTTASRAKEEANRTALNRLVKTLAIAAGAEAAAQTAFPSTVEATAALEVLTDAIDEQMADPLTSDDSYSALQALKTDLAKAVLEQAQGLPQITQTTPQATMPLLPFVYDLYGAVELQSDVLARNPIRHPGFLRGGSALEVLDHG